MTTPFTLPSSLFYLSRASTPKAPLGGDTATEISLELEKLEYFAT